jgi:intracellular sulfur oxidation DsrE/DsrF family protein
MTLAPHSRHAARRGFLGRLTAGAAALGSLLAGTTSAQAQSPASGPLRHEADDWMDTLPRGHRLVFDAVSPVGAEASRWWANNFLLSNESGYGVDAGKVGVIIVLRHNATAFAYSDAMWAKYGPAFAESMGPLVDPSTGRAPTTNLANQGRATLDALTAQGVHVAYCGMATRRLAGAAAKATGGDVDAIYQELMRHVVRNAHFAPAGIVALSRAQERGYTFAYGG